MRLSRKSRGIEGHCEHRREFPRCQCSACSSGKTRLGMFGEAMMYDVELYLHAKAMEQMSAIKWFAEMRWTVVYLALVLD